MVTPAASDRLSQDPPEPETWRPTSAAYGTGGPHHAGLGETTCVGRHTRSIVVEAPSNRHLDV
jgi:hypothetical protein